MDQETELKSMWESRCASLLVTASVTSRCCCDEIARIIDATTNRFVKQDPPLNGVMNNIRNNQHMGLISVIGQLNIVDLQYKSAGSIPPDVLQKCIDFAAAALPTSTHETHELRTRITAFQNATRPSVRCS